MGAFGQRLCRESLGRRIGRRVKIGFRDAPIAGREAKVHLPVGIFRVVWVLTGHMPPRKPDNGQVKVMGPELNRAALPAEAVPEGFEDGVDLAECLPGLVDGRLVVDARPIAGAQLRIQRHVDAYVRQRGAGLLAKFCYRLSRHGPVPAPALARRKVGMVVGKIHQ